MCLTDDELPAFFSDMRGLQPFDDHYSPGSKLASVPSIIGICRRTPHPLLCFASLRLCRVPRCFDATQWDNISVGGREAFLLVHELRILLLPADGSRRDWFSLSSIVISVLQKTPPFIFFLISSPHSLLSRRGHISLPTCHGRWIRPPPVREGEWRENNIYFFSKMEWVSCTYLKAHPSSLYVHMRFGVSALFTMLCHGSSYFSLAAYRNAGFSDIMGYFQ